MTLKTQEFKKRKENLENIMIYFSKILSQNFQILVKNSWLYKILAKFKTNIKFSKNRKKKPYK